MIDEQDIDPRWTFDVFSTTTNDRGPYRTMVGNGNWPVATSAAAVQLGNARRALDEGRAVVTTKAPMPDHRLLASSAAVQGALTEAEGLWQAAAVSVDANLAAMWEEAERHGRLSKPTRVALHRHVLARCHRDAHALRPHISVGGAAMEHNTQVDLDLESEHLLV